MSTAKEYFAFISYQRKDEKIADELRHKLEHYHLPSSVRKENPSFPKTIYPIFRDALELSGGVLSEQIEQALAQSKYLIVVCSPNSAKSPWVNKEVQTFIRMGKERKIIPFIIDGEPNSKNSDSECFPPALRELTGSRELLGININELGREAAAVKIVACMFGLKFDSLWQRFQREQKRKKWMMIGGAVLFAVVGLTVGFYFVKQNQVIEFQNDELNSLVSNLEESNNTYSQLQKDLKQYIPVGQLRGNECDNLWAIDYHPYEPIIAFWDNWGVWLHYLNSDTEISLPSNGRYITDVFNLKFSIDGTELIAEGSSGVFMWNVDNCELIYNYKDDEILDINNFGVYKLDSVGFCQKFPLYFERISNEKQGKPLLKKGYADKINLLDKLMNGCINTNNRTIRYELKNGNLVLSDTINNRLCSTNLVLDENSNLICMENLDYNEILFITPQRAALYDDTKEKFVLFFKGYDSVYDFGFSKSGEYLRVGKNIYARKTEVDTISHLEYVTYPKVDYPKFLSQKNSQYDELTGASLSISGDTIIYRCGNYVKKKEVLRKFTMGNGQEYLSNVVFAGSNKVVAVVKQGKMRVYNTNTWNLIGAFEHWTWEGRMEGIGYEKQLSHADSYVADIKYVNRKLYILSSAGVIRIYNVDKYRLESIIELPIIRNEGEWIGVIDQFNLSDDASQIYYSFKQQPFYYVINLSKE